MNLQTKLQDVSFINIYVVSVTLTVLGLCSESKIWFMIVVIRRFPMLSETSNCSNNTIFWKDNLISGFRILKSAHSRTKLTRGLNLSHVIFSIDYANIASPILRKSTSISYLKPFLENVFNLLSVLFLLLQSLICTWL